MLVKKWQECFFVVFYYYFLGLTLLMSFLVDTDFQLLLRYFKVILQTPVKHFKIPFQIFK